MMIRNALIAVIFVTAATACRHEVNITAPDKPIEINLNVKIDQEVRVRLEKEVQDLIADNPDLF